MLQDVSGMELLAQLVDMATNAYTQHATCLNGTKCAGR